MRGRFVERYTWDDIQDLYELPDGPPRNLPAVSFGPLELPICEEDSARLWVAVGGH
jgi:hypothetical protein